MDEERLKKKFKGYFHDPVFKAFILSERVSHEKIAKEILQILAVDEEERVKDDKIVKEADHVASAADRLLIPKQGLYVKYKDSPEVLHPFSSEIEKIKIDEFIFKDNRNELANTSAMVFKAMDDGSIKNEKLFLLFFELYEVLLKNLFKNKKTVSLLPADTRFPDHSIWEHLSTVSAIASALPEPAFFIFSISPVQSFIMTAKKTRDFWLGSYMLSYLTWKAIEVVVDEFGPDSIVFPDLHGQPFFYKELLEPLLDENKYENKDIKKIIKSLKNELKSKDISIPSIPNRFLAIVNYSDGLKLKETVKKRVKDEVESIGEKILSVVKKWKLNENRIDKEFENLFEIQLENYFTFSSVIVPWSLDKNSLKDLDFNKVKEKIEKLFGKGFFKEFFDFLKDMEDKKKYPYNIGILYTVLYEIAERFSATQKSLRLIENNPPEKYHKCTLCGEREALHPEGKFGWYDLTNFWQDIASNSGGLIDKSEKLCGVCLTKRLFGSYLEEKYKIGEKFPSTADVATVDFKRNVLVKAREKSSLFKKVKTLTQTIVNALLERGKGYISTVLFEEFKDLTDRSDSIKDFIKLNGELLYLDTYEGRRSEIKFENLKDEVKDKIKKQLKEIYDIVNSKPSHYYAIIKFDGDRMGKILKGALNNKFIDSYHSEAVEKIKKDYEEFYKEIKKENLKRPMSPALHRLISRALRNFSIEFVKEAIEKNGLGKVIYAGGDDVFALLPLENFFSAINLLRAFYSGEVKKDNGGEWKIKYGEGSGWVEKDKETYITLGKFATASLGASIVHWEEPLSIAIKLADEAEKEAKNSGRNAFSIKFKRRSGEIRSSVFNWYYLIKEDEKLKRYDFIGDFVNFVLKLFKGEEVILENESEKKRIPVKAELSPNFIQTLKLEFSRLWEDKVSKDVNDNEVTELFIEEFLRTFKRSLNIKDIEKKNELSRKEKKQLIVSEMRKKLEKLKNAMNPESVYKTDMWEKIEPFNSIKRFLHLLETIHFISKGGE